MCMHVHACARRLWEGLELAREARSLAQERLRLLLEPRRFRLPLLKSSRCGDGHAMRRNRRGCQGGDVAHRIVSSVGDGVGVGVVDALMAMSAGGGGHLSAQARRVGLE